MASRVGGTAGRKLVEAGRQLNRVQRPAVEKAALVLTTSARAGIRSMAPKGRMAGVGTRGARVGARYDVQGHDNPSALIRATGPVHLLERSTKAHPIAPRRRQALRFADGNVRAGAQHPGTRGKHGFGRAIEAGTPAALRALRSSVSDAVIRGFKGLV